MSANIIAWMTFLLFDSQAFYFDVIDVLATEVRSDRYGKLCEVLNKNYDGCCPDSNLQTDNLFIILTSCNLSNMVEFLKSPEWLTMMAGIMSLLAILCCQKISWEKIKRCCCCKDDGEIVQSSEV